MCLEVLDIFARLVDILLVVPCIRCLALANLYRIAEEIRDMNTQTQAVDTVATVVALETIYIFSGSIQCVVGQQMSALVVRPDIRRVRVGDMNSLVVVIAREDIQSELDNAVTSVGCACQGVTVDTCLGQEAWRVRLGQAEAQRVALA